MLIDSIFVSGKCRLNCPDCPYKSDILEPSSIKIKGNHLIEYFYGGDVLEAVQGTEEFKNILSYPNSKIKAKRIIQTTPITAVENIDQLSAFDAVVIPQVLDYQDSIDSTGRDIYPLMEEALKLLESQNTKCIQVVQLSDLNINSIIDNYYLAEQSGSLLILNISDITLNREEKQYLKYLTRKKNVIATQRIPGTCCYTPGFMLGSFEPANLLKLFLYLWRK